MAETVNLELSSESDNHTIYLLDDSSSDDGTIYLIEDDDAASSTKHEILFDSKGSTDDVYNKTSENRFADHYSDYLKCESHIHGEDLVRSVSDEYADEDENCDEILELLLMAELHCVGLKYYSG